MDWDDLRYFLKVADTGGLSPAGRFLRVNASTVGRHIEALEEALGRRLFVRTQRGYGLTEAGEQLLRWSRRVESEFADLQGAFAARTAEPAGTVSIATTEPLAAGFLVPNLPAFRVRFPAVEVEIAAGPLSVSLARREADVALRIARPWQGNVLARRIGNVGFALFASRSYIEAKGMPRVDDGFAGHDLIEWPADYDSIPQIPWLRRIAPRANITARSMSHVVRLAAAQAGLGIVLLACIAAEQEPALVRLAVNEAPPEQPLWTGVHADLAHRAPIRAVLDHLADTAREQAARLRGR